MFHRFSALLLALLVMGNIGVHAADAKPLKVLFLGDQGHHAPEDRCHQLEPVLTRRGMELVYTNRIETLNEKELSHFDVVVIYANHTEITPEAEQALIEFVEGGKGLVPIHCASFCFLNSPKYIALVGGQFLKHGTDTFRAVSTAPDHPIMKGYVGFESWDETYVHAKHNEKDRTVLEVRVDGGLREPWTWVRKQGKGRIFYTASGHDERTWAQPGFQQLVERGIRWSAGLEPSTATENVSPFEQPFPVVEINAKQSNLKPFEYDDVGNKIPNYAPHGPGDVGKSLSAMQRPLPPAESAKHLVVPKNFRAKIFADEESFDGKPICMTWDERGRLWVALTLDYPNELKSPGQGRDRIVCCEDTNGDGKADKVTTFAEGLSIPTSLICIRGGLLVFDGVRTLFLKDTDGDGKADQKEVLFTGWGLGDTHGGPSNMQYGLDNWIWGMNGYDDTDVTVGGERVRFRQGFFRFKPDASKLEFIRSTNNNTWGLGFSEEGIVFGSTANGNPSEYMPIPNRYYEGVRGWTPSLVLSGIAGHPQFHPITKKVRQVDYHGGYTAAAGHALYTARAYPTEYWNRTAFVCEPTGHLVGTFVINRDGSGFKSTNPFNLVASDDEWTAPIMAEVGPDGNVWVLDWYNYIVQHNPTPNGFKTGKGAAYETDLRDKVRGRIYRIVYDGDTSAKNAIASLSDATPTQLVAALKSDNMFWRKQAQRLLVERGDRDVLPELMVLARDSDVDTVGLNTAAIHALWVMHGLGALDGQDAAATEVATACLKHPSAGVRRNAVQVLPNSPASTDAIISADLLADSDPQVRLMSLLALADQPAATSVAPQLIELLNRTQGDRWLSEGAIIAAAKNAEQFLIVAAGAGRVTPQLLKTVETVAEHYARGGPTNTVGRVITALADGDLAIIDSAFRGLSRGWPMKVKPELDASIDEAMVKAANKLATEHRGGVIRLGINWKLEEIAKLGAGLITALQAKLRDPDATTSDRIGAAREFLSYRASDPEAVEFVLDLITPQSSPDLAAGLTLSLRTSDAPRTAELLIDRVSHVTPEVRSAALTVLLARQEWTAKLIEALNSGLIPFSDLSLEQKRSLSEIGDQKLRQAATAVLARGGALPNADRQRVIDDYAAAIKNPGNATLGKNLFVMECAKCHRHAGDGKDIGPDLTGMASHPKQELLVHILDPNRSVEGNFRVYTVITRDGLVMQGKLDAESKTSVELVDAQGKRQVILRSDIDELISSNKSLMPEGFEKQVPIQAMADLLEFLTKKGKFVPLPLDKVATVISTRGMFFDESAEGERIDLGDWSERKFDGVPFKLVDPKGGKVANAILLYGPQGTLPPKMPKSVSLPCNSPVRAIHLLSGIGGWAAPFSQEKSTSVIVRLHYADGTTEDHELKNGVHFADYVSRSDVPGSKFAFSAEGGQQLRYLAIYPKTKEVVERIEFIKGKDETAPIVMAVTIEVSE